MNDSFLGKIIILVKINKNMEIQMSIKFICFFNEKLKGFDFIFSVIPL